MRSKTTVAIGMSGGIDSSVAAYLLKQQGFNVIGFTLKLWDRGSRCCDIMDIYDAQILAKKFNIPHYIIDLQKEFKQYVIDYFINEYIKGRTPNPCVICNQFIKFDYLFQNELPFKYDLLATGHYVKIKEKHGKYFLSKAKDTKKSQEYFLARLKKEYLNKIIFPLADLTKDEVKQTAKKLKINLRKRESQELCFIANNEKPYEFIIKRLPNKKFNGKIITKKNKVLGKHNCYFKYTIGQRQGLGISDSTPYYVIGIDGEKKNVIVGKRDDTYKKSLIAENLYWYENINKKNIECTVKIRYNHKAAEANVIKSDNNKAEIEFIKPQHAVTPGQLAIFYKNDIVIGSGWIT